MPSASSAKPAAAEAVAQESSSKNDPQNNTPIRQAIIIIEHKIRNLDKRKVKLEVYRELQRQGKDLNQDQKVAVAKYDEVAQTLEFARDLCKQFHNIVTVTEKEAKKLARKEELARRQADMAKIREVLFIQDALTQMGAEATREDHLLGRNGATQINPEDLQLLDDLYPLVTPKHPHESEEERPAFTVQVQQSAEHLLALVNRRQKDFSGSTFAHVKQVIDSIHNSGYLDKPPVVEAPLAPAPVNEEWTPEVCGNEQPVHVEQTLVGHQDMIIMAPDVNSRIPDQMPPMPNFPPVPAEQLVQQSVVVEHPPAGAYFQPPAQTQPPQQLRPLSEMLETGSFFFLQESELDSPPEMMPPPQHTPIINNAAPIPSQTFTNQNFTAPVPTGLPPPIPMPPSHTVPQQPQHIRAAPAFGEEKVAPSTYNPPQEFDSFAANKAIEMDPAVVKSSISSRDSHKNGNNEWITDHHNEEPRQPRPPRNNPSVGGNRNRSSGSGYYQNNYYQNNGYGNAAGNSGGGGGNYKRAPNSGGQRNNQGPRSGSGPNKGPGQYNRNKQASQH